MILTVKKEVPQKRVHIPRTKPSCACIVRIQFRLVKFQILTYDKAYQEMPVNCKYKTFRHRSTAFQEKQIQHWKGYESLYQTAKNKIIWIKIMQCIWINIPTHTIFNLLKYSVHCSLECFKAFLLCQSGK